MMRLQWLPLRVTQGRAPACLPARRAGDEPSIEVLWRQPETHTAALDSKCLVSLWPFGSTKRQIVQDKTSIMAITAVTKSQSGSRPSLQLKMM